MIIDYLAEIKNNESLLLDLKKYSCSSDEEICGFIMNCEFFARKNIHPDPFNFFLIDPKDYMLEENVIVFHSHPKHIEKNGFSDWDLENQRFFDRDMVLYSVYNNEFYYKQKLW